MLKNWEWSDTWQVIGIVAIVALSVFLGFVVFSPKNVDYYYISSAGNVNGQGVCAFAHWTWHTDERAYCSDNKDNVLDFVTRENASLPRK